MKKWRKYYHSSYTSKILHFSLFIFHYSLFRSLPLVQQSIIPFIFFTFCRHANILQQSRRRDPKNSMSSIHTCDVISQTCKQLPHWKKIRILQQKIFRRRENCELSICKTFCTRICGLWMRTQLISFQLSPIMNMSENNNV